jgi:hypothetical protein
MDYDGIREKIAQILDRDFMDIDLWIKNKSHISVGSDIDELSYDTDFKSLLVCFVLLLLL